MEEKASAVVAPNIVARFIGSRKEYESEVQKLKQVIDKMEKESSERSAAVLKKLLKESSSCLLGTSTTSMVTKCYY